MEIAYNEPRPTLSLRYNDQRPKQMEIAYNDRRPTQSLTYNEQRPQQKQQLGYKQHEALQHTQKPDLQYSPQQQVLQYSQQLQQALQPAASQDTQSTMQLGYNPCLLYTSPSPRDGLLSRMPSSA